MNLGKSPNRTAAIAELFGLLGNAVIEKISTSTAAQVTETEDHAVYGEYVTMPQGFNAITDEISASTC
jgi:hypothetical protein